MASDFASCQNTLHNEIISTKGYYSVTGHFLWFKNCKLKATNWAYFGTCYSQGTKKIMNDLRKSASFLCFYFKTSWFKYSAIQLKERRNEKDFIISAKTNIVKWN